MNLVHMGTVFPESSHFSSYLLNSGPGTSQAGPELALYSPHTWRLLVGWLVGLSGVTLSSRAPKQAAELKFGTDITFRE